MKLKKSREQKWLRGLVSLLFSLYLCCVTAVADCSKHLLDIAQIHQRVPDFTRNFPVLSEFLNVARVKRFHRSQGVDYINLEEFLTSCSLYAEGCIINFNTNRFNLVGHIQVRNEEGSHILELVVNRFSLFQRDLANKEKKKRIAFRQRPKGLSVDFMRLVWTLFSSLQTIVRDHSEVDMIRIEARSVVNPSLALTLAKMGFQSKKVDWRLGPQPLYHLFNLILIAMTDSVYLNVFDSKVSPEFLSLQIFKKISTKGIFQIRRKDVHDWVLDFPLSKNKKNEEKMPIENSMEGIPTVDGGMLQNRNVPEEQEILEGELILRDEIGAGEVSD